jgi:hypothetical protein
MVPCDMRWSFDGLSMMAEHIIRCKPFSDHLLAYCNQRADRLKMLYWDRDGWVIWYKRLEGGTSQFLFADTGQKEIAACEAWTAAGRHRPQQGPTAQTLLAACPGDKEPAERRKR